MPMTPGPKNLITDVPGMLVGNAGDERLRSGVTVLLADRPFAASIDVRGGGPGTRESDLLAPDATVSAIDAIVLSGGSAFGLAACDGVMHWLAARGRGFAVGNARVPIVPGAILFDLLNGGDKEWGETSPYPALGRAAAADAGQDFALGNHGAGLGATTATVKGGLGSASMQLDSGVVVGALAAVNAVGSPLIGSSRHFWAAPFEIGKEFGGLGLPHPLPGDATGARLKGGPRENTTLAIIATNAPLGKADLKRLAVMAHDGLARALYPVHTPLDGDVVFAISSSGGAPASSLTDLGIAAANTLARAVARGIYEATSLPGGQPAWRDLPAGQSISRSGGYT